MVNGTRYGDSFGDVSAGLLTQRRKVNRCVSHHYICTDPGVVSKRHVLITGSGWWCDFNTELSINIL